MDTGIYDDEYAQELQLHNLQSSKKPKIMSQVYFNHTTKLEAVKLGAAPAATIALKREGNYFIYGITICSKLDNYSKKHGREIALRRLEQDFRRTLIPSDLLALEKDPEVGERAMCIAFLYQLAGSVTLRSKNWKKKITRFNKELREKQPVKIINNSEFMANYPDHSPNRA